MSIKPTKIPRWGATAPGTITATIVEPSEDKKTVAFVVRERPPSEFLDWLFYIIYTWIQYLSDGALSGNHSIAGTLDVNGNTAVVGALAVSGNVTVADHALTFVDFTYTADNTADTILHTAHGLLTSDGPVRTSNSGGALPGGLAAGTDYYFIRVDANTGKLATSRANALAGTAINLTTDGTGTQTLLHQAGTTRPSDVTITGRYRHGTLTMRIPAMIGSPLQNGSTWTLDAGGVSGAPFPQWSVPVVLPTGKRITDIRGRLKDNATGPSKLTLTFTKSVDAVETGFGVGVLSAGSGVYQTLAISGINEQIAAGTTYYATMAPTTGTAICHFQWIEVDYDEL